MTASRISPRTSTWKPPVRPASPAGTYGTSVDVFPPSHFRLVRFACCFHVLLSYGFRSASRKKPKTNRRGRRLRRGGPPHHGRCNRRRRRIRPSPRIQPKPNSPRQSCAVKSPAGSTSMPSSVRLGRGSRHASTRTSLTALSASSVAPAPSAGTSGSSPTATPAVSSPPAPRTSPGAGSSCGTWGDATVPGPP